MKWTDKERMDAVLAILEDPEWLAKALKRVDREIRTGEKG